VASDYEYMPRFDDVEGWELPHGRRVHWFELPEKHTFRETSVGRHRFSRVRSSEVIAYAETLVRSPPTMWQQEPLPSLPPEEAALCDIPEGIRELVGLAQDLHGQYWSGQRFGERPREDELVAHFVVPLLRAAGWQAETIAVKWRDIDVAVFRALPRTPQNCRFVIEAKRLGACLADALGQARTYLDRLGVRRDVVVTDGMRFTLYSSAKDYEREAYLNLARPKPSGLRLLERISRS